MPHDAALKIEGDFRRRWDPMPARAIAGKAPRHRWHSWHSRQRGICNLQNLKDAQESVSLVQELWRASACRAVMSNEAIDELAHNS
jgi:hypothetical protein